MSYLRACSVRLLSLPICLASASFILGADEPTFSEQQKIDFMQNAKVIKSKERCSARKGVTTTWLLTLSDGTVTYDACFQPVDESKTVMQFADEPDERADNFRVDCDLDTIIVQTLVSGDDLPRINAYHLPIQ